jgi:hypothetical protein
MSENQEQEGKNTIANQNKIMRELQSHKPSIGMEDNRDFTTGSSRYP